MPITTIDSALEQGMLEAVTDAVDDRMVAVAERQAQVAEVVIGAVLGAIDTHPAVPAAGSDIDSAAERRRLDIRRRQDPQAWLFAERTRYLTKGHCDPYAEFLLRQAGLLRG